MIYQKISEEKPKMRYPNIEAERARKGLSQTALSSALNISRKTYYNWVTNGKIPQIALEKMASLFEVSTDYLLGQTEIRN